MSLLVLVRHGESRWNVCNRFTGWVDVPLSENGVREAEACAAHCAKYDFSAGFTSSLERAHATLLIILSRQHRTGIIHHEHEPKYARGIKRDGCDEIDIPIFETPALNERYYGALQGMNKTQAEKRFGKKNVLAWRRGYDRRPPQGESLADVEKRIRPFFKRHVLPRLVRGQNIIVAGHGNALRTLIKHLERISDRDIAFLDLPEAEPIVYDYRRGSFKRLSGDYTFKRPLR